MTKMEEAKLLRDIHSIAKSLEKIAEVMKDYQIIDIPEVKEGDTEDKEWI